MNERDTLLDAVLAHLPFEGMNERALMAGAADAGISAGMARVHFPQGGASLAAAYHRRGDTALRDWMATNPPPGRFRDKITAAVWQRLMLSDRELARAAAAVLALPQNAPLGARLLWETADTIWVGLGDHSRDLNWYSKRATLAAVQGATVLFWLGDDSEGAAETREFLDRRIEGVMRFEGLKARARKLPGFAALADRTTGWIRAPEGRNLPGRTGGPGSEDAA